VIFHSATSPRYNRNMKKIVWALWLLIGSGWLAADSFFLRFNQGATDNLFQNRYGESEQISTLAFSLDKTLSPLSLFTTGRYARLYRVPGLSSYSHDVGLDYLAVLNPDTALYISGAGRFVLYGNDYNDFNYVALTSVVSLKSYLTKTSVLRGSYSLEMKIFKEGQYDFFSQQLLFSLDKYFSSRTTIKAEFMWGRKSFSGLPEASLETTGASGDTNSRGKGWGGNGTSPNYFQPTTQKDSGKSMQIVSLGGLVAQGLGNRIGLRVAGLKQWVISGRNPFTFIEEYYMVENPSFDTFSWAGTRLNGEITFLIPGDIEFKIGYTFKEKEFPGIDSFDLEGISLEETRRDKNREFEVRVEKDFARISLFLDFSHVRSDSTDPLFDWKGNFVSLGVRWNMFFGGRE